MTKEAAEPEVAAVQAPQPTPEMMAPLVLPPELQQALSQQVLNALGAEIGALRGQLIVSGTTADMEKAYLQAQVIELQQQLKDAGVVPKSDGGQPPAAAPGGTAPAARVPEARPQPAKKAAGAKRHKR